MFTGINGKPTGRESFPPTTLGTGSYGNVPFSRKIPFPSRALMKSSYDPAGSGSPTVSTTGGFQPCRGNMCEFRVAENQICMMFEKNNSRNHSNPWYLTRRPSGLVDTESEVRLCCLFAFEKIYISIIIPVFDRPTSPVCIMCSSGTTTNRIGNRVQCFFCFLYSVCECGWGPIG